MRLKGRNPSRKRENLSDPIQYFPFSSFQTSLGLRLEHYYISFVIILL